MAERPLDEKAFQAWYRGWASKIGLNPNPDDPAHQYDYRAAYQAGAEPSLAKDGRYHWPSEHKMDAHPNRFIGGVDTRSMQWDRGAIDKLTDEEKARIKSDRPEVWRYYLGESDTAPSAPVPE